MVQRYRDWCMRTAPPPRISLAGMIGFKPKENTAASGKLSLEEIEVMLRTAQGR